MGMRQYGVVGLGIRFGNRVALGLWRGLVIGDMVRAGFPGSPLQTDSIRLPSMGSGCARGRAVIQGLGVGLGLTAAMHRVGLAYNLMTGVLFGREKGRNGPDARPLLPFRLLCIQLCGDMERLNIGLIHCHWLIHHGFGVIRVNLFELGWRWECHL